jgi:lysophospholipase L1-like esterase
MDKKPGKMRRILARAREVWLILGVTLVLLLALETALSFAYAMRDRVRASDPASSLDWRARADVYSGQTWVYQYYREFTESSASQWVSYVYWRRKPYQGQYINVDPNGIRRTWTADSNGLGAGDRRSIFVFGGSTLWGVGARDDATIPSFLAKELKDRGIDSEVINFGESGYVSTQEVVALLRELQKGHVPDLVIFYDGVNDVYSAYQQKIAGLPENESHRVQEFNLTRPTGQESLRALFLRGAVERLSLVRLSRGVLRRLGAAAPAEAAVAYWSATDNSIAGREDLLRQVVSVYEGNVHMVKTLGEAYGFKTLFYWQPTIFSKTHLTAYEETQRKSVEGLQPFCQGVYALAYQGDLAVKHDGVFRDLSGIFAEVTEPVFIDWCHISEWGNEGIAEQMAADTAKLLSADSMVTNAAEPKAAP